MARATNETASEDLAPGWVALAEARWGDARDFFADAAARDGTPPAHEGLSWAAWWLDDADAVFAAREEAYRRYRRAGDASGAARMATWLACDQLDFLGATAVAAGWLRRARRLLDPVTPGPDHGWLAFMEGYLDYGAGNAERAAQLARDAAAVGQRFAVADLEMLGLALEGATLVARTRIEEGMRRLDEAAAAALEDEAEMPIANAWAFCFLVTACTAVRDYGRAAEWCDRIAEFAERFGSRYMLAFCSADYGLVHLWRGRWTEAEAAFETSVDEFSRSRPAMVGSPLVGLAELRRRQGRPQEAARLLERAGPTAGVQLCRARIALDAGRAEAAVELAERVLRHIPGDRHVGRAPALELLVRARAALGEPERADAAMRELGELARLAGTQPLGASAAAAEGLVAAASGDHERARTRLEDAVDGFERDGGSFEAAEARIELAAVLVALGRAEDAAREARAALQGLADLGATQAAGRARRLAGASETDPGTDGVTAREREVLGLLAEGLTNREIARRLVVSEHTVHRHVTNILRKLEVPTRAAAAAHAVRTGLVQAPDGP